jgi:hypothetical protein
VARVFLFDAPFKGQKSVSPEPIVTVIGPGGKAQVTLSIGFTEYGGNLKAC